MAVGRSFLMITDGNEPAKTTRALESIRALNVPNSEILVGGVPRDEWSHIAFTMEMSDYARAGRLGAMRNLLCQMAFYDKLVVVDDDIMFDPGWYAGMLRYESERSGEWQVLSCRILNPDGSRFWDWKTYFGGVNKLLDYDKTSPHVSITGGLIIMRSWVFEQVQWDAERGFYQAEDVDFSDRLKRAFVDIAFNPYSQVTHDAGYTQRGDYVYRTEA